MMKRKNGRNEGEVFTGAQASGYILDEAGYLPTQDLRNTTILEPSAGTGALAILIIERLYQSSQTYGFSFIDSLVNNVRLIEHDRAVFDALVENINRRLKMVTENHFEATIQICQLSNFLLVPFDEKFDCIVGNPPYIRHERIPEEEKAIYRQKFATFKYRADLYIAFFEKALGLLKRKGKLCFVCSNRWLNNQYGEGLRELIGSKFHLRKLLNLEKASLFDEQVLAYPCITVIENSSPAGRSTFYFETHERLVDLAAVAFTEVPTPATGAWQQLFISYDLEAEALGGIPDQGFEIGIGVATGADKVFILDREAAGRIEESRLLPLVKAADLKNDKLTWGGSYLVNPFDEHGLCSLNDYPKMREYLEASKGVLSARHTARNRPEKWYKTIDRVKPALLSKAKLLLPDLAGNKWLFIDEGNYYPHHNVYYITGLEIDDLKVLATLLMSEFVREQLFCLGIRMSDGLPRLQAQALNKLRVPLVERLLPIDRRQLIKAYEEKDLRLINEVVNRYCKNHVLRDLQKELKEAG